MPFFIGHGRGQDTANFIRSLFVLTDGSVLIDRHGTDASYHILDPVTGIETPVAR